MGVMVLIQRRRFFKCFPIIEANDSCGMASLDTSCMDLRMTVFSHYKSMGVSYLPEFQSN